MTGDVVTNERNEKSKENDGVVMMQPMWQKESNENYGKMTAGYPGEFSQ